MVYGRASNIGAGAILEPARRVLVVQGARQLGDLEGANGGGNTVAGRAPPRGGGARLGRVVGRRRDGAVIRYASGARRAGLRIYLHPGNRAHVARDTAASGPWLFSPSRPCETLY